MELFPIDRPPTKHKSTNDWLTPPDVQDPLGGWQSFDLDPSSPVVRPFPTAQRHFTIEDNGLIQTWDGRVWLNPPYGKGIVPWMARMAEHDHGIALIFARTSTLWFHAFVFARASALFFVRRRIQFLQPNGLPMPRKDRKTGKSAGDGGAASVLCAYGTADMDVLAHSGLDGRFVPLRLPRGVVVALAGSWADLVRYACPKARGPVALDELYRDLAGHPKTRANPHWRAKIRQTLQKGPFRRVGRGQWECAA